MYQKQTALEARPPMQQDQLDRTLLRLTSVQRTREEFVERELTRLDALNNVTSTAKLTRQTQVESCRRLHEDSIERRKATQARIRAQYANPKPPPTTRSTANPRVYSQTLQRRHEQDITPAEAPTKSTLADEKLRNERLYSKAVGDRAEKMEKLRERLCPKDFRA